MLDVERWAELRREHFVRRVSIRELSRRFGIDRNTVRRALRSDRPPRYERLAGSSKLDVLKDEIHELLRRDPKLPAVRVKELIEPLGFGGGQTIVNDYLREVRSLFEPPWSGWRRDHKVSATVSRPTGDPTHRPDVVGRQGGGGRQVAP